MNSPVRYADDLMRGRVLREQHRYKEAEGYLNRAIEAFPNEPEPHYELGFCYCNTSRPQLALKTTLRALNLNPLDENALALKAWILGNLRQHQQAILAAEEALARSPYNLLAINARTRAWIDLRHWRNAEASSAQGLALDPRGSQTVSLMVCILRFTGRPDEARSLAHRRLAEHPSDCSAHVDCGWIVLEAGEAWEAQVHFREALRLDPNDDGARQGLLESLHARVWFYRWYIKLVSFVVRQSTPYQIAFFMGLYLIIITVAFGGEFTRPPGWVCFCAAFFTSFILAKPLGDFFLLWDGQARLSLSASEKALAWAVATGFVLSLCGIINEGAWTLVGLASIIPLSFLAAPFFRGWNRKKLPLTV